MKIYWLFFYFIYLLLIKNNYGDMLKIRRVIYGDIISFLDDLCCNYIYVNYIVVIC